MPEDIKKIIVVIAPSSQGLSGWNRWAQEGTRVQKLLFPGKVDAAMATLLTGASPEIHGVDNPDTACRAEYVWEAALRSSKKTALFGWRCDRPPAIAENPVSVPSVVSFLRTSPDWDLCWIKLEGNEETAAAGIIDVLAEETLRVVVGLPDEESEGFCLFAGVGVKKGAALSRKVSLEDIVPTICYLAEISIPAECEGGILYQALEDPDLKTKELRACRRNYERLRRSGGPSAMC